MSTATTPATTTVPARNYYPSFKSNLCAWQGYDIQAGTLQGVAGTGGVSHFLAGSIGAADIASGVVVAGSILTDTGSSTAYVVTPSPVVGAYAAGQTFTFKAAHANTAAATLAVSGLAAKNIFRPGGVALSAGDIQLNQIVTVEYDGTQFNLMSGVTQSPVAPVGWYQGTDTGAANAYVVAMSPAATAYVAGMQVDFMAANNNTGASTINVNGLGVKNILQCGGTAPLFPNQIRSGDIVSLTYDGTQFQLEDPANDPGTFLVATLGSAATANADTSLFTGATLVGSQSIPSLAFQVGRILRIRAAGVYGTTNAGVTQNLKIKVGATTILATGAVAMPSTAATNGTWTLDIELIVTATGASGGIIGNGVWEFIPPSGTTTKSAVPFTAITSAVTVDTTAARVLDLTANWGTVNASNTMTMTNASVEMLN